MPDADRRLAAILSADVAGYSLLMADDEDATVRTLHAWREQVAALISEHRGRLADFTGDNFLAEFPAARDAVECALEIQRVIEVRGAGLPEARRMRFRIGGHLGDVRHEDDRLFGDGVNIAARLQPLAEPGGLCLSALLVEAVRGKLDLPLEDLGKQQLKNIPNGVHAYRVRVARDTDSADTKALRERRAVSPLALGAAALTVLAIGAFFAFRTAENATDGAAAAADAAALSPIRSLAVLPLANLSRDPDQEFFADGMTETLIAELAKLPGVRVISRTSVMQFKGAKTPLRDIARALNVEGVIEGSVMRAGERVRITAQLIDARSDEHLWAEQYDRELARVLEIQSEVARAVASEITLALTPEQKGRLAPPKPVDPRAQEAYFRGLAVRRWKAEALRQSIAEFEEAIRIAPDYAAPYAALANSRHFLAVAYGADPRHELPKARVDAKRAVALDPNLGDAHAALAGVLFRFDWDFAAAEQEFERGLSLGVSDPWSRVVYGSHLFATGRPAEAWRWLEAVAAAAPLDSVVRIHFAALLANGGEYERAIREANRVLASDSSDTFALVVRAICYERLERFDDALRDRRAIAEADGSMAEEARVLEAAWRTGGRVGYLGYYQRALDFPTAHFLAASSSAQAGARDLAIEQLERAYATRDTRMPFLVTLAALRPLHSDPRFADLARRMNLPPPKP